MEIDPSRSRGATDSRRLASVVVPWRMIIMESTSFFLDLAAEFSDMITALRRIRSLMDIEPQNWVFLFIGCLIGFGMACLWVYMRNMDYAWKARYAVRPSDLAPVETRNGEEHDAENTSEDDGLLGEDEAIERSTFKHVERTKEQMQDRLEKIDDDSPEHDALVMATASAMERAGSRCIGLYVTLLIEMFVALAVVENSDVLEK